MDRTTQITYVMDSEEEEREVITVSSATEDSEDSEEEGEGYYHNHPVVAVVPPLPPAPPPEETDTEVDDGDHYSSAYEELAEYEEEYVGSSPEPIAAETDYVEEMGWLWEGIELHPP